MMSIEEKRDFRQELGMVFQGSALFDSLNVEENVIFPLKMFTQKTKETVLPNKISRLGPKKTPR